MSAGAVAIAAQAKEGRRFGAICGFFLIGAAGVAAGAPVWLSIWSVFLFAGPHNWMEARYLLARMPVRWVNARPFFWAAIAGVAALSAGWGSVETRPLWHGAFLGWVWLLARLHDARLARRWRGPVALMAGAAFLAPAAADYAVVYAHPLMAFWFLDRQVRRSRPEWTAVWRGCLALLPALAATVAWSNRLEVGGSLELSLAQQAGHPALVAVHAFLELAHYAIWIVALPLLGMAQAPWQPEGIPLVRHKAGRPWLVKAVLLGGAAICALLWLGFAMDYETTRTLYFTLAIVHVLAEAPFLIRLRNA
jgi:hypothetical protein